MQKSTEFSANAFLNVYNGHMNTFQHIRVDREESFHKMMGDIYQQARWVWLTIIVVQSQITGYSEAGISSAAIADIEFNDIDEWWDSTGLL